MLSIVKQSEKRCARVGQRKHIEGVRIKFQSNFFLIYSSKSNPLGKQALCSSRDYACNVFTVVMATEVVVDIPNFVDFVIEATS